MRLMQYAKQAKPADVSPAGLCLNSDAGLIVLINRCPGGKQVIYSQRVCFAKFAEPRREATKAELEISYTTTVTDEKKYGRLGEAAKLVRSIVFLNRRYSNIYQVKKYLSELYECDLNLIRYKKYF